MKKKNAVVGNFLLTSRKRGVNFAFTAQSFSQIDVRIRRVTDFLAIPQLTVDERICRLMIFSHPSMQFIRMYKFLTEPIFDLYNTNEVIDALPDENEAMDLIRKPKAKSVQSQIWENDELFNEDSKDEDEDDEVDGDEESDSDEADGFEGSEEKD
jgi:hypothetical protein